MPNPKLSEEGWFLFFVNYTDLCTGHFIKKQLIVSFGEQFMKSHKNRQSHVSDLDKKQYSKFSYCYIGLGEWCFTKEAIATLRSTSQGTLKKSRKYNMRLNGNKNITM